jgi:hypothetical protein
MSLIEIINNSIQKAGGIGAYYQAVSFELFPSPTLKMSRRKSVLKYRFTTEYLKKNSDGKMSSQMAREIGVSKTQVTRRLKELGIKKKFVHRGYQHHIQETSLIINIETGIFYPNCSEAARALNYDIRTLQMHIKDHSHYKVYIKVA